MYFFHRQEHLQYPDCAGNKLTHDVRRWKSGTRTKMQRKSPEEAAGRFVLCLGGKSARLYKAAGLCNYCPAPASDMIWCTQLNQPPFISLLRLTYCPADCWICSLKPKDSDCPFGPQFLVQWAFKVLSRLLQASEVSCPISQWYYKNTH